MKKSYHDFTPASCEGRIGKAIYLGEQKIIWRAARYDQLGIVEDEAIWNEIFEHIGTAAIAAVADERSEFEIGMMERLPARIKDSGDGD